MKPELTQAGIEAAAIKQYKESLPYHTDSYLNGMREGFIKGANHVLSHLPEERIAFAEWAPENGWQWGVKPKIWIKFWDTGSSYFERTSPELHAEYEKHLETIKTKK